MQNLEPLKNLSSLADLNCSDTQVQNLEPLKNLPLLATLDCSQTKVREIPMSIVWRDSFEDLYLDGTPLSSVPTQVLSSGPFDNCLESLRAHLRDLESGPERLPDVKALVLGNGRIGKTQICRRLRGKSFESNADSTHGIRVTTAMLPMRTENSLENKQPEYDGQQRVSTEQPTPLHLWDFGGQDLYHGTHALFLRTQSLVILVWTPPSENSRSHEHDGMTFRNHPLTYWMEHVRHGGGANCPVLIVQNMCEVPEVEELHPPVTDEALKAFSFRKVLHYSALADRGRGALDETLQDAVRWLRRSAGEVVIGKGRLEVKRRLEAMRDEDASRSVATRKYRVLSQEFFRQICVENGGVSDPAMLLDYLYKSGIVFYHKDMFDDQIILDQQWALDAIYAVFHRQKCYHPLRYLKGRFTRRILESLAWQNHKFEEQELFLSLMTSCGICFVHRTRDPHGELETEYVAPDLLPDRREIAPEIDAVWAGQTPRGQFTVKIPFLHEGISRNILSRIGQWAKDSAVYWRYGVCFYEKTTNSRAMIEQQLSEIPNDWSGRIVVSTRGGQGKELLEQLRDWITEELERSGHQGWHIDEPARPRRPPTKRTRRPKTTELEPQEAAPSRELQVGPPPPETKMAYYVSYAWDDESKDIVNRLCDEATQRKMTIQRDVTGISLGDSIKQFMDRLVTGDRIFVILSGKYLQSPNCMYELFEVWRNCKRADHEFRERVRVYRLKDAHMMNPVDRTLCARYWREQFAKLDALVREDPRLLAIADFQRYKLMEEFAHHVGDVLALIADTLHPRDFEELKQHGFDGLPPSIPPSRP